MTNIIYEPIQDEDPVNVDDIMDIDEDEDDLEEKEELIRMIYLAQCMTEYGGIDVRHNRHFARHVRLTYFLKHTGEHLRKSGLTRKIRPSFLKNIRY